MRLPAASLSRPRSAAGSRTSLKACAWGLLLATSAFAQNEPAVPPAKPLDVPPRIGVLGTANLGIDEVIQRVLANDRDLAV